jgi:integrase
MALSLRSTRRQVHRKRPSFLTIEEIDRIITTANSDPRLHITSDVVQVLKATGLRSVELSRLQEGDIDIANSRLVISSEMMAARRSIPLTPQALNSLQCLHSHFPDSTFVMGDKSASALHRVSANFRKITTQLGIVGQGLHSLRRFCLMRLIEGGVDSITVARYMGFSRPDLPFHHERESSTFGIYMDQPQR